MNLAPASAFDEWAQEALLYQVEHASQLYRNDSFLPLYFRLAVRYFLASPDGPLHSPKPITTQAPVTTGPYLSEIRRQILANLPVVAGRSDAAGAICKQVMQSDAGAQFRIKVVGLIRTSGIQAGEAWLLNGALALAPR
jgi:hypothetical protein